MVDVLSILTTDTDEQVGIQLASAQLLRVIIGIIAIDLNFIAHNLRGSSAMFNEGVETYKPSGFFLVSFNPQFSSYPTESLPRYY